MIIGATPEGKKELVGLIDGVRESAQSWKELLLDLKRRGLAMGPELAVADGALGFWKALPEVWPKTRGVKFNDGIEVVRSQAQTAAASPSPSPKFGDSSLHPGMHRTGNRLRDRSEPRPKEESF